MSRPNNEEKMISGVSVDPALFETISDKAAETMKGGFQAFMLNGIKHILWSDGTISILCGKTNNMKCNRPTY